MVTSLLLNSNDQHKILLACCLLVLCLIARYLHLMTLSGAIAAAVIGTLTVVGGGLYAPVVFAAFFVSSNLLGRWRKMVKEGLGFEKSGERDAGQVLANGLPGVIGLMVGLGAQTGSLRSQVSFLMFSVAVAEANADTWATEIGAAAGQSPRSIVGGHRIAPGQSGGITPVGLAAALAGSMLIGIVAMPLFGSIRLVAVFLVSTMGFAGSLIDSVLGATLQVQYRRKDGRLQETPSEDSKRIRGLAGVHNDAVNFLSGITAAAATCLIWMLLRR